MINANIEIQPNPKEEKKKAKKKKKFFLIGTGVVASVAAAAILGISVYVGINLTHKPKKEILETPSNYGMAYEERTFLSKDGETNIEGWVIESVGVTKGTIIMSHGYSGNRIEENVGFLPLGKSFAENGYRVVMFDFRASGLSGGKMITVGAKEKLDLLGVINWVETNTVEPIILYGISMGAATSILAGSENENVQAVIADSPFSDLRDYLETNLPVWTGLPDFPFTPVIIRTIPIITELDPNEASPITQVKTLYPRPVLFIHAKGDSYIPYTESVKMVENYSDKFQLWTPDGSEHVKAYVDYQEEYLERVFAFLNTIN